VNFSESDSKKEALFKKILGCLAMVAIGDALGMPAHDMTRDEIKERFGGSIRDFASPFKDSRVHKGMRAGQTTDDTGLTLAIARAYAENGGKITPAIAATYIADWVDKAVEEGLGTMIGTSTKQAVLAFKNGTDPTKICLKERNPMIGTTNGGAMKISPVGLVHPGNIDAAVKDAVMVCLPTHGTQAAISAGCAMAAGVSEAMTPHATVFSVVKACLAGARKGELQGRRVGRTVPFPSVSERTRLAVSIALESTNANEANRRFAEVIGTGLAAYESIPTAIGIFLACDGDPKRCVIAGANVGYDTDTIASMAGALSGALKGFNHVPSDWYRTVQKVNGLDLTAMANRLLDLSFRDH
jgi:ADP-ribosylglycohydrolase